MQDELNTGKFIVFKIADFLLALPIDDVLKVVKYSAVENRGLSAMGIVQLGKYAIRLLDLHLPALGSGDSPPQGNRPFLVITRGASGELCGIAVDEPPELMELPLESIQSLPPSDRHGKHALEWVSHIAVLAQDGVTTTIFLLDVKRVTNVAVTESYLPALKPS